MRARSLSILDMLPKMPLQMLQALESLVAYLTAVLLLACVGPHMTSHVATKVLPADLAFMWLHPGMRVQMTPQVGHRCELLVTNIALEGFEFRMDLHVASVILAALQHPAAVWTRNTLLCEDTGFTSSYLRCPRGAGRH